MAGEVARQFADAAAARGVDVRVRKNLPLLRLDTARVELVFSNLIANAIKFSDAAKPRRFVDVYGAAGDQPTVIVRDNNRHSLP